MALTSPGIVLAIEALFGNVKPALDKITKLGMTDFSKEAPGVDVKPGTTLKVPISTISAASAFNKTTNNYLTGGATAYGDMTCTHYLQGFDLTGENIDSGVSAPRMRQLFAMRAGKGIGWAMLNATVAALNDITASTAVKLAATRSINDYLGLGASVGWLDKSQAVLVVNGAEAATLKGVFAAAGNGLASWREIAEFIGFADIVVLPTTAAATIVPAGTMGFLSRVPAIVADYKESGTETDDETGLSVGIVVASAQDENRLVVNADMWFGVKTLGSAAGATSAGIIKCGVTA